MSTDTKKAILSNQHNNIIDVLSFAIMPNHYHFLLKQNTNNGLCTFISSVQNSYAKYFNIKNQLLGSLFPTRFKAVLIENNEQLIHVSRYIHLNPVTSKMIKLEALPYYSLTSFCHYMKNNQYSFIRSDKILKQFNSINEYKNFVFNQADYQIKLHNIKNKLLD